MGKKVFDQIKRFEVMKVCRADPSYSGTKTIVAIWTRKPAQEGDQFL